MRNTLNNPRRELTSVCTPASVSATTIEKISPESKAKTKSFENSKGHSTNEITASWNARLQKNFSSSWSHNLQVTWEEANPLWENCYKVNLDPIHTLKFSMIQLAT